jgi:hypothetical protein
LKPILFNDPGDKIKTVFDRGRAFLKKIPLVIFGNLIFPQSQGDVLRVSHRLNIICDRFVQLGDKVKNTVETRLILRNLGLCDAKSGEAGNTGYIVF